MNRQPEERSPPSRGRAGPPSEGPSLEQIGAIIFVAFAVVMTVLVPVIGANFGIIHQIPEGHVGVYWRGGAILKTVTEPGFHALIPFITKYEAIQVTIQTDQVTNIPCGTKGGVMIGFDKIEVVNKLKKEFVYETISEYGVNYDKTWIYDKIHHEINQFCSAHSLQEVYIDKFDQIDEKVKEAIMKDLVIYAPGIEIIGVRVTKPSIPLSISRNYEQMEEERTKVLIAKERQQVVEKEAETEKKKALSEAEKSAQVSAILMQQKLQEKEANKRQQEIENEIFLAKEKSLTDAEHYRVIKEAEANSFKLTEQYLELKFIEAIANNTKIFFGDKLPQMVLDQRLLGSWMGQK